MNDRNKHIALIKEILAFVNAKGDNPFVLKGGTALSLCYSLSRFSEDIDFDAPGASVPRERFRQEMLRFCEENGYPCRLGKDTMTTQKAYVTFDDPHKPLKVEVSYRRKDIPGHLICRIGGIQVYTLDEMARLKAAAYAGRDKIRDLYDVTYICTHFYDELGESARDALRMALEYKDLDQFDYIVRNQHDELIDSDVLETMFLEAFDRVGLLSPEPREAHEGVQEVACTSLHEVTHAAQEAGRELERGHVGTPPEHEDGWDRG